MKTAAFSCAAVLSLCGGFLIVMSVEFINARPLCSVVIRLSIWPQTDTTLLPLATSQTHHMSIWCVPVCVCVCVQELTVYIISSTTLTHTQTHADTHTQTHSPKPQEHWRWAEQTSHREYSHTHTHGYIKRFETACKHHSLVISTWLHCWSLGIGSENNVNINNNTECVHLSVCVCWLHCLQAIAVGAVLCGQFVQI